MPKIKQTSQKQLSSLEILKLESKMAQDHINAIKKRIALESETVEIPVVEQKDKS